MKTVRVSAAVICDGSAVYATRRAYGESKGWWEFPGGKREEGESGESAIVREIREELGIEISVDRFLGTVGCQYPSFYLVMDCYICSIKEGQPSLSVHDEARWLERDELWSVKWLPADELVIRELEKE